MLKLRGQIPKYTLIHSLKVMLACTLQLTFHQAIYAADIFRPDLCRSYFFGKGFNFLN